MKIDSSRIASPIRTVFRQNVVKINPLSLLLGQFSAFYERALINNISVVVGYGFGSQKGSFGKSIETGNYTYKRFTVEARRYWRNKGLSGFYAGPYLRMANLSLTDFVYDQQGAIVKNSDGSRLTAEQTAQVWTPGLLVGRQHLVKRFVIDGFLGIQHHFLAGTLDQSNELVDSMSKGWSVRIGLTVGGAF